MKRLLLCCTATLLLLSFTTKKKLKPKLPGEFVFIPAGSYYTATADEDPYYYGQSKTKRPMDSSKIAYTGNFYMSKYEVTNLQYRQFFNEVSVGMSEEEKEKIACDSLGWRMTLSYGEPMMEYYNTHPAFNNYPMVNVRHEAAIKYCEWLQQKLQLQNPDFIIEVKLPAKEQWTWAAMGGRRQAMYPWGNFYLRNKKGEFLCNFKIVGDQSIYRNRTTGKPEVSQGWSVASTGGLDRSFFTAQVKSFYPNDYGLYNMCGNAAEMIAEKGICMGGSWDDYGGDVKTKAESKYENTAPTVGFRPIIIVKEK